MDRDDPVDGPPFRWPDQPMMGDPDGMQGARQLAFPKAQKAPQFREIRGQIIVLPDIELKQAGMVGQMINGSQQWSGHSHSSASGIPC